MNNLLDEIIANDKPRIYGAEHNLGNIDAGTLGANSYEAQIAALKNGCFWDEREYGISREQQIAKLEAANTPEAREQAMAELRQRAIRRADLDTSNGRVNVMVAVGPKGEALPWHKLGTFVVDAVKSKDAAELGGLNWLVKKKAANYYDDFAKERASTESFILYRSDTGDQVGACGSKYKPIQNAEGFEFLDTVLGEFGARYETCGSIRGGRNVWMQARLPKSIQVQANDPVDCYAMFTLDHTGAGANKCFPTTVRTVCANTYRLACGGRGKGISLSHVGDIKGAIAEGRKALGLAVKGFESFGNAAAAMVRAKVNVVEYADNVLDVVLKVTAAQAKLGAATLAEEALEGILEVTEARREKLVKDFQTEINRRDGLLEQIMERYETSRCTPRGSSWAAFNAVTETADWGQRYVGKDQDLIASRRFESMMEGDADELKQVAYEKVLLTL